MNEPAKPVLVASSAGSVDGADAAHRVADQPRSAIHRRHVEEVDRLRFLLALDELLVEKADDRLRQREVAGGEQHEYALARLAPVVDLAELGDVVDAGVGARVGGKDQSAVQPQCDAVGHRQRPQ